MLLIGLEKEQYELLKAPINHHILISGPRGSGKTSLIKFLASAKRRRLTFISSATTNLDHILTTLLSVKEGDIIAIDEIHRLNKVMEEALYVPMEEFILYIPTQYGGTTQIKLPQFTLIGTTTQLSALSKALKSRFVLHIQIPTYSLKTLSKIVKVNFPNLTLKDSVLIAHHSIVPREAINLAKRVVSLGLGVQQGLAFLGYKNGLTSLEFKYLDLLKSQERLSLNSISSILQISKEDVQLLEEKLLRRKLIKITSSGRSLTFEGLLLLRKGGRL